MVLPLPTRESQRALQFGPHVVPRSQKRVDRRIRVDYENHDIQLRLHGDVGANEYINVDIRRSQDGLTIVNFRKQLGNEGFYGLGTL